MAPDKAQKNPAMFADTGVPLLFERMYAKSCKKHDSVVKVTGGAKLYDDNGTFEIGKRNHILLRKMFWRVGVSVAAEDVGGFGACGRRGSSSGRVAPPSARTGREVDL